MIGKNVRLYGVCVLVLCFFLSFSGFAYANKMIQNGQSATGAMDSETQRGQKAVDKLMFKQNLNDFLDSQALSDFLNTLDSFVSPTQPQPPTNGTVTFDNVEAPCVFSETTALRGRQEKVTFLAPDANGGGILHECSEFGIDASSEPNFLAFNPNATYSDGGIPKLPQIMILPTAASQVSMKISSGEDPGTPMAIIGLGKGQVQDILEVVKTETWETYTIQGSITAVVLFGPGDSFVVDDIEFFK